MGYACELWPLDPGCLPEGWPASSTLWDAEQRQAVEVATGILNDFTAGTFGLCTRKVRPCRKPCVDRSLSPLTYSPMGVGGGPWTPMLVDGHVVNMTCAGCGGDCGCSRLCEILLDAPVYDVHTVKIDGVALANTAYRVDDRRRLVRIDGGCWPDCQQLDLADTQVGTFSVTYRTGVPVPAGGRMAVTDLAVQVWKACRGKTCALSERVTSIVREGVAYTFDNLDVFERGRTGISRVDLWLVSVNPYGARTTMRAYSPDTRRASNTSWPVEPLPPGPGPTPPTDYFVYVQNSPQLVWTIIHNLGFYPAGVRVEDSTGADTVGEVSYLDSNTVRIEFNTAMSGVAYLS